jgi:hypothetical protein
MDQWSVPRPARHVVPGLASLGNGLQIALVHGIGQHQGFSSSLAPVWRVIPSIAQEPVRRLGIAILT